MEGNGWAGPNLIANLSWVSEAETIVYWGDMDAAGFEILNSYRAHGLKVKSIFMDINAYDRYERFGTNVDVRGKELEPKTPVHLDYLTDQEQELYLNLISPSWNRYRRIEQERIPLEHAREVVIDLAQSLPY